jgi:dihydrolipoamide dehydrogenase
MHDLLVIGSGPAGYTAAARAGALGLNTALVEKYPNLGGTCLNVGCIPSKALLASSEHLHFARHGLALHGIDAGAVSFNLARMMERKQKVVQDLNKGIAFLLDKAKVTRLQGHARLTGPNSVRIEAADGSATAVEARHILLATGSVPAGLPFLPFDEQRVLSSTGALALDTVPQSLLVIGAGAIGLELGSVWSRLGAKVEIVEFLPRIAAGSDPDISKQLQRLLEQQGLRFHLSTKVATAQIHNDRVTVTGIQGDKELTWEAEKVLVAIGRKPCTENLGLDTAGVALTDKGRIRVNDTWQTSVPSIFAVGDVIDGPMLAHKAEAEGTAVVERLAGHGDPVVDYALVPNVIYTSPEAASVGFAEDELKERGIPYRSGKYNFIANGRAKAAGTTDGFAKVLADGATGRLLGVHILAANASELIAPAVFAMQQHLTAAQYAHTLHAHPTLAEVVKEAAHAAG